LHIEAKRRDSALMEMTLKQTERIVVIDPSQMMELYHWPDFDNTLLVIFTQLLDSKI